MFLKRDKDVGFVLYDKPFKSSAEYVLKIIDLFYSLKIHRNNRLTDRERLFFCATVIIKNLGIESYKSEQAGEIYLKIFGKHKKSDRGDYIKKLEKKEWLKSSGGDVILPEIFENINLLSDKLKFTIDIRISNLDESN